MPNNMMSLSNAHYNVNSANRNIKVMIAHFLITIFLYCYVLTEFANAVVSFVVISLGSIQELVRCY